MSDVGGIAAERLKSFVTRIRNLEAEKKGIGQDVKEVYAEAKGTGFDTKVIRKVIKWMDEHEKSPANQQEQETILELYKEALGLIPGSGMNGDLPMNPPKPKKGKKGGEAPPAPDNSQTDLERHLDAQRGGQDEKESDEGGNSTPAEPTPPPVTEDEARAMGKEAGETGVPISANPFDAADPNRAAWELAWCDATGSDGMDLPTRPQAAKKAAGKAKGGRKGAKPAAPPPSDGDKDADGNWQNLDDNFSDKKDE